MDRQGRNNEMCSFCDHNNGLYIDGIPYCDVEEENTDSSFCRDAAEEYALWQMENDV